MEHSTSYERIIPVRAVGTMLWIRILLSAAYVLLGACGALWVVRSMDPAVLLLTLLGLVTLILLTKNFLYMEYEISCYGGRFSVAKIYGKRRRRLLAELDAEQLLLVDYDTEEGRQAALRYGDKPSVRAVSDVRSSPALILAWEDEEHGYHRILLESDERTEQLLRRFAPRACSLSFKLGKR